MASLLNHEKLLESLGFQKRGTFWEWQSASPNSSGTSRKSTQNNKETQNSEESLHLALKDIYFTVLQESITLLEARLSAGVTIAADDAPSLTPPIADACCKKPQPQPQPDIVDICDTSCSEESIPIENEIYSKSAASEKSHMKFEEVRST